MEAEFAVRDCADAVRRFGLTADESSVSVPYFGTVYRVPVFGGMDIALSFCESDDEFPRPAATGTC